MKRILLKQEGNLELKTKRKLCKHEFKYRVGAWFGGNMSWENCTKCGQTWKIEF
jgi:hypothetical protein